MKILTDYTHAERRKRGVYKSVTWNATRKLLTIMDSFDVLSD